jgi:hypothetical protein
LRKKFGPDADERIGNLEELKTFAIEVDRVTMEHTLPELGITEATLENETSLSRFLGNIALMTDVRDEGEDKVDCVKSPHPFADFRSPYQQYMQRKVPSVSIPDRRSGMASSLHPGFISRLNSTLEI